MDQMQTALNALETAVLKLESAVHTSKKKQTQTAEQITELKQVIQNTYHRLDKALSSYRQGGE